MYDVYVKSHYGMKAYKIGEFESEEDAKHAIRTHSEANHLPKSLYTVKRANYPEKRAYR